VPQQIAGLRNWIFPDPLFFLRNHFEQAVHRFAGDIGVQIDRLWI